METILAGHNFFTKKRLLVGMVSSIKATEVVLTKAIPLFLCCVHFYNSKSEMISQIVFKKLAKGFAKNLLRVCSSAVQSYIHILHTII